jgi:hypothetical protein
MEQKQEKQARSMVEQFQTETEQMEKNFDKSKSGDIGLTQVRTDATQFDKFLTDTPLGANVSDQWNRVK